MENIYYLPSHEYIRIDGKKAYIGISEYAARQLGNIVYVDMPEVDDDNAVEIKDEDIRIDVYRSSGAGGQKVNKTETAIRITHFPTGIVVTCQNERSQLQNKEMAFQYLRAKLIERQIAEREAADAELKGEIKKIEWGSQIRSYVFCPYTLVKDHRTGYENTNVQSVMDGDIQGFIIDYLKKTI